MSNFFQSEEVISSVNEMDELYQTIFYNFLMFPSLTDDKKRQFITDIKEFVEKQKILFFRMNLSDDPDAKETKDLIFKNARSIGLTESEDMNEYFQMLDDNIKKLEESMR